MKEIFKEFEFGGLRYRISNYGTVVGLASGRVLMTRLDKDGYEKVTLGNKIHRTAVRVHRLVAIYFIDNPNNLPEVNHIDFNRSNNKVDNLEWVTHEQNINYTVKANRHAAIVHNYCGSNNPNYNNNTLKLKYQENPELAKENQSRPAEQNGRARKIYLYDEYKNFIQEFEYIGSCAKYLIDNNIAHGTINSVRCHISKAANNNKKYLNHYYLFEKIK